MSWRAVGVVPRIDRTETLDHVLLNVGSRDLAELLCRFSRRKGMAAPACPLTGVRVTVVSRAIRLLDAAAHHKEVEALDLYCFQVVV